MRPEHRRYLLIDLMLGPVLINVLVNVAVAALLFGSLSTVPFWGAQSVFVDTVITAFVLPLATSMGVAFHTRALVRREALSRLTTSQSGLFRCLAPFGPFARGTWLGVAALVLAAAPLLWLLDLQGGHPWPLSSFLLLKAAFAGGLAAITAPILGWAELVASSARATQPAAPGE